MEIDTRRAPACPCCTLISESDIAHTLSMRRSEESLLRCKACETEARERSSESMKELLRGQKSGPGAKAIKASHGTGGGGSKAKKANDQKKIVDAAKAAAAASHSATFVCMTCCYACCAQHAISHFMDSGKKRTKKGGPRHVENHCVFFNTEASEPSVSDFRGYCVACDIPVGTVPLPDDTDYADCLDGYAVNSEGHLVDGEDYLTGACVILCQALERAQDGDNSNMRRKMKKYFTDKNGKKSKYANSHKKNKGDGGAKRRHGQDEHHQRSRNPEITEQGIVGLQNLGNTCFFNSVLQCMLQLRAIRDAFGILLETDLPGPMSVALRRTFGLVEESPTGAVLAPRTLFGQVCSRNPMFAEYGQQDANEVFNCIANGVLDEHEIRRKKMGGGGRGGADDDDDAQNNNNNNNNNAATMMAENSQLSPSSSSSCFSTFGGEVAIAITCHSCKTVSQSKEKIIDLSLSIHSANSVINALRDYFTPQILTGDNAYLCEKCCHEEFLLQKRMEEAAKRQREEMAMRLLEDMQAHGGLQRDEDEIVKASAADSNNNNEDDGDDESSSSSDDTSEEDEESDDDAAVSESSLSQQSGQSRGNYNNNNNTASGGDDNNDNNDADVTKATLSSPAAAATAAAFKISDDATSSRSEVGEILVGNNSNNTTVVTNDDEKKPPPSSSTKKKYCEATSEFSLSSVKDVIVLQLKRFSLDWKNQRWVKDNSHVAFTTQLDLSEFAPAVAAEHTAEEQNLALLMSAFPTRSPDALQFVLDAAGGSAEVAMQLLQEGTIELPSGGGSSSSSMQQQQQQQQGTATATTTAGGNTLKYRLIGVVEHQGTADGGHYVSYFRSMRTGSWYYASDSWVKASSEADALRAEAYMLFYERC